MEGHYGSKDLFLDTIAQMGCNYEVTKKGYFRFNWQSGAFYVKASNDSPFITVWNLLWKKIDYNKDSYSKVSEVVNEINRTSAINIFYAMDEDDDFLTLHSKREILFVPTSMDIRSYLEIVLNEFIVVQYQFNAELLKLQYSESYTHIEIMSN